MQFSVLSSHSIQNLVQKHSGQYKVNYIGEVCNAAQFTLIHKFKYDATLAVVVSKYTVLTGKSKGNALTFNVLL